MPAEPDLCVEITIATATRLRETIAERAQEAEKAFRYIRWLMTDDGYKELDEDYCDECVGEVAKTTPGGPWRVDGWDETFERDSEASCTKCGCPLHVSLTSFGERELWEIFAEPDYELHGSDWVFLERMLQSVGCMKAAELARILPIVMAVFAKVEATDG